MVQNLIIIECKEVVFVIKNFLFLCITLMLLAAPYGKGEAAGITTYEKFIVPSYWTEHNLMETR